MSTNSPEYIATDPEKDVKGGIEQDEKLVALQLEENSKSLDGSSINSDSPKIQVETFTFTVEEERVIVRKLDQRVLSICTILFMLSFLDRSNIGNANLAGMSVDLSLSSADYQWLLTVFYIGYVLAQPGTLLWKAIPARVYVTILTLCWGTFSLLQAATTNFGGMLILRLLLGASETAYGPGVPFYFSFFYAKKEIGLRQGLFLGAAPIATAYAGALAYAITSIQSTSISKWRILFLLEGFPAILMAPVAYYFLPNKATTANFLTERERKITLARAVRDGNTGTEEGLKMSKVFDGLKDYKSWIQAFMYFSCNVSYSSLPVFLPTILAEMGFTAIHAQGLTAPPYLLSFFVLIAASFYSDKIADRSIFIISFSIVGGAGYLILALAKTTAVRYFAIYLCVFIFPVIGLILPWVSSIHSDDSSRGAGFMLLNIIGQCGPFLGTRIYPAAQGPYYVTGMAICSGFMFFAAALALLLRLILIKENKKKDQLYGKVDASIDAQRIISNVQEKIEDQGPSKTFRYVL